MYVRTYACKHICVYINIHTYVLIYLNTYIYVYIHTYVYVHLYIYLYMCVRDFLATMSHKIKTPLNTLIFVCVFKGGRKKVFVINYICIYVHV